MFVWFSWKMFWGSKGFLVASYLLLFCCFGVWKRTFFRSNCLLVPGFFGLVVFSARALLILCFCLFGVLWVLVSFFSVLFVILGLSFLHCSVPMLLLLLHVLDARFSVWVFGLPFYGNPLGGRLGMGTGGANRFLPFLIIGVFGLKHAPPSRARVFFYCFVASKGCIFGSSMTTFFNSCPRKRYKNRVFRSKHVVNISDPPVFTSALFLDLLLWHANILVLLFGGFHTWTPKTKTML